MGQYQLYMWLHVSYPLAAWRSAAYSFMCGCIGSMGSLITTTIKLIINRHVVHADLTQQTYSDNIIMTVFL